VNMKVTVSVEVDDEKALLFLDTLSKTIEHTINSFIKIQADAQKQARDKFVQAIKEGKVQPGISGKVEVEDTEASPEELREHDPAKPTKEELEELERQYARKSVLKPE